MEFRAILPQTQYEKVAYLQPHITGMLGEAAPLQIIGGILPPMGPRSYAYVNCIYQNFNNTNLVTNYLYIMSAVNSVDYPDCMTIIPLRVSVCTLTDSGVTQFTSHSVSPVATTTATFSSGIIHSTAYVSSPSVSVSSTNCATSILTTSHSVGMIVSIGVVCSLVFLVIGVLLGAVSVYLLLRARGKLSLPLSSSPPPLPPPATYEEVDVSGEVTSTQKIQLNTNEANAFRETIPTSLNIAYGQVEL